MPIHIDTTFDFYSDTPEGLDPDARSPTLCLYHRLLWSKSLPAGQIFELQDSKPNSYLYHCSSLGEYSLASDAITHTYKTTKAMSDIIAQVPSSQMEFFFSSCSTIGGYTIFPGKSVDRKMTINQARGVNHMIKDRFDITLECIRLYYLDEQSPLSEVFNRYHSFFNLFRNFRGYVDFFLFQDIVSEDYGAIKFHLPFSGFGTPPLPRDNYEYQIYQENVLRFVFARNKRIAAYSSGDKFAQANRSRSGRSYGD